MKLRKFALLLALIAASVMSVVGLAYAEPHVQADYRVRVDLQEDGTPNYGSIYFHGAFFGVNDVEADKEVALTIMGGDYTFQFADGDQLHNTNMVPWGQSFSYETSYLDTGNGGDYYTPKYRDTNNLMFEGNIATNLPEKRFSFTVDGGAEVAGQLPKIRTRAEQMATYAPSVELITGATGEVSGLDWRFVDPNAPDDELVKDTAAGIDPTWVGEIRVVLMDGSEHHVEDLAVEFDDGDIISNYQDPITFDTEIAKEDIQYIRVTFADSSEESGSNGSAHYSWEFMPNSGYMGAQLSLSHVSKSYIEDWQTNHRYSPDGDTNATPLYNHIAPVIYGGQGDVGTIAIDFKNETAVHFEEMSHYYNWQSLAEERANGETPFTLYRADYSHFIGNTDRDNDVVASFYAGAESALPGQPFALDLGGKTTVGAIAPIYSTAAQIQNGCIPFLEFDEEEIAAGEINNIRVRFGDSLDSTGVVTRDEEGRNISGVQQITFIFKDGRRSDKNASAYFDIGDDLECIVTNREGEPLLIDNLLYAALRFVYDDADAAGNSVTYEWRFYVAGAEFALSSFTPQASATQLHEIASDAGASGLTEIRPYPSKLLSAEDFQNITEIDQAKTLSAIAIEQAVTSGGAVAIGRGTTLPVNAKTFDGTENDAPRPETMEELQESYAILKMFSDTVSLDLLAKYGEDVFEITDNGVVLRTILAIVDDAAPSDAEKPSEDSPFGVKLNAEKTILYIYDGEKDGRAKDPIPLTKREAQEPDSAELSLETNLVEGIVNAELYAAIEIDFTPATGETADNYAFTLRHNVDGATAARTIDVHGATFALTDDDSAITVTGVPTASETYTILVEAENVDAPEDFASASFKVVVFPNDPVVISADVLANIKKNIDGGNGDGTLMAGTTNKFSVKLPDNYDDESDEPVTVSVRETDKDGVSKWVDLKETAAQESRATSYAGQGKGSFVRTASGVDIEYKPHADFEGDSWFYITYPDLYNVPRTVYVPLETARQAYRGSSSGCDAGFGVFALLAAGGALTLVRKKDK